MRSITISFLRIVTLDVFSYSDRYQQDEQTLLLRLLPNRTRIRSTTTSKVGLFVVRSSVAARTIPRLYLRPDGAWMFVPTTLKVRPGPSVGFYAENMYLKRCSRSVGALDYRPEWPSDRVLTAQQVSLASEDFQIRCFVPHCGGCYSSHRYALSQWAKCEAELPRIWQLVPPKMSVGSW